MVETAVWLAAEGFAHIGWAPATDGKAPKRKWKSDATDDPALIRKMLRPGRNALVIPKGQAAVVDVDDPATAVAIKDAGMPPGFRVASPTEGHEHLYTWMNGTDLPASFAGGEVRRGGSGMVLGPWALRTDGTYTPNGVQVIPELPAPVSVLIARLRREKQGRENKAHGSADEGWQVIHGRHDFLVTRARNLRGIGLTGERLTAELLRLRDERCSAPGGRTVDDAEVTRIAEWTGENITDDSPEPEPQRWEPVAETVPDLATAPRLPETFWSARPYLTTIRQAAQSRQRAPDAVLGAILARVAALCPHTLGLPAIVGTEAGLSLLVAIVAPPGYGKSNAAGIAGEMVPGDLAVIPSGSGQGFVEAFFDLVDVPNPDGGKAKREKRQVRHNLFCYVDEGQSATRKAEQASSTLFATWRTVFSGGLLGDSNASAERNRIVTAGSYSAGIVVAFQPEMLAALFDDLPVGTPARFLYLAGTDPSLPDDPPAWPGSLDGLTFELARAVSTFSAIRPDHVRVHHAVAAEVRRADLDRQRGRDGTDGWAAHRNLLRLKVAALLAFLDDRMDLTPNDWQLAGIVLDTSDGVRAHAQAVIGADARRREDATSTRMARRAVLADDLTEQRRAIRCAEAIAAKVRKEPGALTRGTLKAWAGAGRHDVYGEALDMALGADWIVERTEPGQGADKVRLYPGEARP